MKLMNILLMRCIIIEIKNGPYFGPDKDRVRIETK